MIVLQICLAIIYMLLIPCLMGCLVLPAEERQREDGKIWTLAAGLMSSYVLYEILALIFIKLDKSFRLLSVLFVCASVLFAAAGAVKAVAEYKKKKEKAVVAGLQKEEKQKEKKRFDLFFLLGILLIVVQIGAILLYATPDQDDAFYSGLSSICLSRDCVLKWDAYSGQLKNGIGRRYVVSALPAYQATLSLFSSGLHHLVITHNLFPLFYMPLAYALLYSIGKRFLRSEGVREAKGKLLFCLALGHMIGNYYVFSPENFLVTRIWQGKALFVAIGVPCLWQYSKQALEGMAEKKGHYREWALVAAVLIAVSFMGETGLYLGPFMLMCMCLTYTLIYKKLRHLIPAVICLIPEAVMFAVFIL